MSTQPEDPSPHQTARAQDAREGEAGMPPPGFWKSAGALFDNRNAKVLLAIVVILLLLLGIAMLSAMSSTPKGPGTGFVHLQWPT